MSDFLLRLNQPEFVAALSDAAQQDFRRAKQRKHPVLPELYAASVQLRLETAETLAEQSSLDRMLRKVSSRIDEIESLDVNEIWIISRELFDKIEHINGPVFLLEGQIPIFLAFHDFEDDPWLDAS